MQYKDFPLTSADYVVFAVMLTASTSIGIYFGCFGSRQSTISQYLMGGRNFKSLPVAISMVLCHITSISLVGMPAEVYKYGATYLLIWLSMLVLCLIIVYIYIPVLYNLQLTSIYEYLQQRFDTRTRLLGSVLFLISSFLHLVPAIYVPILALSNATGIDFHVIVPVVCGICIFYTAIGGLKSVVWVDVLQGVFLLISMLTILVLGIQSEKAGDVWSKAKNSGRLDIFDFDFDPTKRESFWIVVIGMLFFWIAHICTNQSIMQKLMAVPTISDCVLAVLLFGFGATLIFSGNVFIGLVIYAKYSDCDPFSTGQITKMDELVPLYVVHIFGKFPGLLGLFFAAIFGASLSTFSTLLNGMAGVVYEDILKGYVKKKFSEQTSLILLKLTVLILGVACSFSVFLVTKLGGIFQLTLSLVSVISGPLAAVFIMGLLLPKFNAKGAFFGAVGGLISIVCIMLPAKYYEMNNLIVYQTKPISTENCQSPYNTTLSYNTTFYEKTFSRNGSTTDQPNFIFRLSFLYYSFLGFFATVVFGTIISYITRKSNRSVDKKLIVPFCHFLLPKESNNRDYESVDAKFALTNPEEAETLF